MFLASLLLGAALAVPQPPPPKRPAFDPARDPQRDVWAAVDAARPRHRRILLDVGGEWCSWCRLLDRTIEGDPALSGLLADRYVVVKVNVSPENRNREFLSCFPEIDGYPHFIVLDEEGRFLVSQGTGEMEEGKGYDRALLMKFLRRWAE